MFPFWSSVQISRARLVSTALHSFPPESSRKKVVVFHKLFSLILTTDKRIRPSLIKRREREKTELSFHTLIREVNSGWAGTELSQSSPKQSANPCSEKSPAWERRESAAHDADISTVCVVVMMMMMKMKVPEEKETSSGFLDGFRS